MYEVYYQSSDGNNYYMSQNGTDYLKTKTYSANFYSVDDAKMGIKNFTQMRKLMGLNSYPIGNKNELLPGKWVIKSIDILPKSEDVDADIEIQERKKKPSTKPKRKPVKKVVKKCGCK